MQTPSIKQQAHQLLNNLPDTATWEDVMYRIYVRQAIDAGIQDSDAGKTVDVFEAEQAGDFLRAAKREDHKSIFTQIGGDPYQPVVL